jgi:hypothetical protein
LPSALSVVGWVPSAFSSNGLQRAWINRLNLAHNDNAEGNQPTTDNAAGNTPTPKAIN